VSLSASERERYQRHLTLQEVGPAGQEKLKAARVLIVGVGGLGSPAALYLAASGAGTLGLVDGDVVESSNLQRQVLFDNASVGRPKVDAARERLLALNPHIDVRAHHLTLRAANVLELLRDYDVVLDGTDRIPTRYVVNDACVIARKVLVSGAIHRFEGQVMTYVPGNGPCYRCLYPSVPAGLVPNCADAGVLGVLPGVVGTMQATEAIKWIVGAGVALIGRLLVYDALEMSTQEFRFERRTDCAVCGHHPTITAPSDEAAGDCDLASLEDRIERLRPVDLQRLMRDAAGGSTRQGRALLVVDVREPREYAVAHLPGAVNISVAELESRLAEIPQDVLPVFVCRSGARSQTACNIALRGGLDAVANLEGGVLAWAGDVDSTFAVAPAR
jgi:adenylyltransferase/sulfurtransferase